MDIIDKNREDVQDRVMMLLDRIQLLEKQILESVHMDNWSIEPRSKSTINACLKPVK